jgi:predicted kinase
MSNLYCCIGLPRSGKSTYCNQWVLEKPGRVKVCGDDIRLALTGERFNSHVEPYISAIKSTMIKTLLLGGFEVIVDGTHTTERSIKQILQIDKNAQFIVFDTHPQTCRERAKATNQEDLYPVIDRMYDQYMSLRYMDAPRYDIQESINRIRAKIVENRIQEK